MNLIKIIGIVAGATALGLAALTTTNPGNTAETSADNANENLRTRRYQTNLKDFAAVVEKLAPTLETYGQNWRLTSTDTTDSAAHFKIEVPVVFFTDDLEIKAVAEKDFVIVNVRSASRIGNSDLGENRRHVAQILDAIDKTIN